MRRAGWWVLACAALVSLVSGFAASPESASSPEVLAQRSTTVETPRGKLQIDVCVTRDSAAGTDEYRYQVSNIDISCALGGLAISRSNIEAEPESSLRSSGSTETSQWVWDPVSAAGQIGPGQQCEFVLRVPGPSEARAISAWSWTLRSSPCGPNKYTFTTLGPYKVGSPSDGSRAPSGTIAENTTWRGEVLVTESVVVPAGVTLTIEPGTVVKFKHYRGYTDPDGRLRLQVQGTLKAVGTAEEPIWFTSDAEDPQNGDWSMLRLVNASSQSEIRFAIIEFAQQGLNMWNSSPTLSDLIVRWNNWEGIYFESYCKTTLERSRIYQNGYNGIAMEQFNDVIIRDCYVGECGTHGIHVDASTATVEGCILEKNRAGGLSVDDNGTLIVEGCRIAKNGSSGIQCGEGQNKLQIDRGTILIGNGSDSPSCDSAVVTWLSTRKSAPTSIPFSLPDLKPHNLGYIPGDRSLDRYMYVYPDVDETRRVVNKIGDGLGLTWSVTWDGTAIWTATLWGTVYRLDPHSGAILARWQFPGPQAWGMTWDGEHLWINDFAEKKVYQMTTSGRVLSSFAIPDSTGGAKGIAWDGEALCIMGWTSPTIWRVDRKGNLLDTIALRGGGGGIAWDGEAFWVPSGVWIQRFSRNGDFLGSIQACSEGTWDLAWDGKYLWATQRTNENWPDAKLYQIEILKLLQDR